MEASGYELTEGDCLDWLPTLANESVDLVVTSPPYDNLRDYADTEWGPHVWQEVIMQLARVLKPGGVVVWIVADATVKGEETGSSFRQALFAQGCGLRLHDTMIWSKGGFSGVGSVRVRYGPSFEYMFIWSKGKPKTFNPIKDRLNKHVGRIGKAYSVRLPDGSTLRQTHQAKPMGKYGIRFDIWNMQPERSSKIRCHPAQFPVRLAEDHIKSWSNPGDLVVDPFMGSGTTGVAAGNLRRQFAGCEISSEYFVWCEYRIGEAHK